MELKKLNLTEDQRSKISKTARFNKFQNAEVNILYEKDSEKKLDVFLDCYRFLINLSNCDDEGSSEEIKQTIKTFLESNFELYKNANLLKNNLNTCDFGRHRKIKKVENLLIESQPIIDYIIDFVYSLGKKITQYDPEESQGYS